MADILLLETDRQLSEYAKVFFVRAGHQLRNFSDPQQAIAAIDESQPDLIILNLFLAPHSGIEFLFELRSYPEWERLPVIIIGGHSPDEIKDYRLGFNDLGISAYIKKTSSLDEMRAAAEQILQPARG